ncbi:hypothetical protein B6D19_10610 [Gilliamella apicola]|uniref:hypothetical protein n=1 Tax=Gilliamella apicola TaxID=1196095 RepID=UPI000A32EFE3|nr:hypothetical protein [Gilliamella apicola]OTQ30946.1 hypothetical protein B6D19_10610 [Gilliamella apicola]OTQ39547.1 hypothetical protein B6D20_10685 [Gilliamella apicola]
MEKFLEFLRLEGCVSRIKNESVIVLGTFSSSELCFDNIIIPENTEFSEGLDLEDYDGEIQLPENLKVACILNLENANVTRLPSNLTIDDDCSVYLDAHKIENVSYRENCGVWNRTIFAFWANNDFLIAAGCFVGTYSEFATAVDKKYDGNNAVEYKRNARDCISELAEKLGKTDPFKNQ